MPKLTELGFEIQRHCKVNTPGRKARAELSLTQSGGRRFRSTFALRRFSVHGDGLTEYRSVECGRDWRLGHGWNRNAGDGGLT